MGGTPRDLQIDEDFAFQRRAWRFQTVGWVGLSLFLAAAALGVFGSGPLSTATVRTDGLTLRYPRFTRQMSPATLEAQVAGQAVSDGRVRLWLDSDYLAAVEVTGTTPEPEAVEGAPDRVTYTFRAEPGDAPVTIRFSIEPRTVFRVRGRAGLPGRAPAQIDTFVYP